MRSFRDLHRHLGLVPADLARQLSQIDVARGRQEAFARQHPGELRGLRQLARVQSVEASNAIEGITAPRKRIQELAADKTTPRNRSEAEIAGYRNVLDTIHSSAPHIPFRPSIVLQLHRDLYAPAGGRGGRWKTSDNVVTEALPNGSIAVRFTPVSAFETPAATDELHEGLNRAWDADLYHRLLLTAAYVLDFLVIHPFADGNGRMSRLLTLLLLYRAGYEVGRFVSLEKIIEDRRDSYYDALGASTEGWHEGGHDLQPWLSFFLAVVGVAYHEFEERVGILTAGRGAKAELVRSFVRAHRSDEFTFADVRRAAPGVSEGYIQQLLADLRKEGVIQPVGAGRGARWRRLRVDF